MPEDAPKNNWPRYQKLLLRYTDGPLQISLDISQMNFEDQWFDSMQPACAKAYAELAELEGGAVVNTDEKRRVGHYWLRAPELAPDEETRNLITDGIREAKAFAADVHSGRRAPQRGGRFENLLLVGIGGSALGPQLVVDALTDHSAPVRTFFLDNTDPDGMARVLCALGSKGLERTLCIVTSKSGGTPETRNGMILARKAYTDAGLDFGKHAVAITGLDSDLDKQAVAEQWIKRFRMEDWVGGRTSVLSVVGLVPACLQGVDIEALLAGAAAMDRHTRQTDTRKNAAMLLALMWHHAGGGKGAKDMVVLPYRDSLVLFSKYLQQLIMESLGKEFARDKQRVEQGIAVYGNKGSTDQHAYVQQLRDGVNNFFVNFIEVRRNRVSDLEVVDGDLEATSTDFLQGFLRGTRAALAEKNRESLTLSIPQVDAFNLGALIALFERAVTFYASLVNINAYHQPGVEAGKKAAKVFLTLLQEVRNHLRTKSPASFTAEEMASAAGALPEDAFHILNHLSETNAKVRRTPAGSPAQDRFQWQE